MVEGMFERPNLKDNNIKVLEFSTELELGTQFDDLIKEQGAALGRSYVFVESYTIARAKHAFIIRFTPSRRFSTESRKTVVQTQATFQFLLTSRVEIPKVVSIPNDIIESLNKMETIYSFRCSAEHEYKNRNKRKFVMALPIKLPESTIFPFRIIDGVSIEGKIENMDYSSLVVNYPTLKITHLLTMFQRNYRFNSHIAQQITNDANMIVNRLMVSSGV
jgi:hypothetical protein